MEKTANRDQEAYVKRSRFFLPPSPFFLNFGLVIPRPDKHRAVGLVLPGIVPLLLFFSRAALYHESMY